MKVLSFKSGLHLIYEKNTVCEGIFVCVIFEAGYFQELPKTGIAHLTEHLVMEAATLSKTIEEKRKLQKKYKQNAGTRRQNVKYYGYTKKSDFKILMQEMAENFTELIIDDEVMQKTKKVIENEMTVQQKNSIMMDLYLLIYSLSSDPHKNQERRFCTDYKRDLENITISQVESFLCNYYTQKNCLVFVTGNVSQRMSRKTVEQTLAKKLPKDSGAMMFDADQDKLVPPCFRISKPYIAGAKSVIMLLFNFKSSQFEGKNFQYAQKLNFINSFLRQLLHKYFREDLALCYQVSSCVYEDNNGSISQIVLYGDKEQIPRLLEELVVFIQNLRQLDLQQELYEEIKANRKFNENLYINNLLGFSEDNEERYHDFRRAITRKEVKKTKKYLDTISHAEVQSILRELTLAKPYVLIVTEADQKTFMTYETFCERLK